MCLPEDAGILSWMLKGLGCTCKQELLCLSCPFSPNSICVGKAEPSGRQLSTWPSQSLHMSRGSWWPLEPSTVPGLPEGDATVMSAKRSAARRCAGIALCLEKARKTLHSAMPSEQLGLMLFQREGLLLQKIPSLWLNMIKSKILQSLPLC